MRRNKILTFLSLVFLGSAFGNVSVIAADLPTIDGTTVGGNITSGSGSYSQTDSSNLTFDITSSSAIIEYGTFDIASGNSVVFNQDSGGVILNRVVGVGDTTSPSSILGTMTATNSTIYLVNEAGITFGADSVINVGALYAAAGNITDADFLAGNNTFTLTGELTNNANISNTAVYFLGQIVNNYGTISSAGKTVLMVTGTEATITESTADGATVSVTIKNVEDAGGAITNEGVINAGEGTVLFGAGDVSSLAMASEIINKASITADTVTMQADGNITSTEANTAETSTGSITAPTLSLEAAGSVTANIGTTTTDLTVSTGSTAESAVSVNDGTNSLTFNATTGALTNAITTLTSLDFANTAGDIKSTSGLNSLTSLGLSASGSIAATLDNDNLSSLSISTGGTLSITDGTDSLTFNSSSSDDILTLASDYLTGLKSLSFANTAGDILGVSGLDSLTSLGLSASGYITATISSTVTDLSVSVGSVGTESKITDGSGNTLTFSTAGVLSESSFTSSSTLESLSFEYTAGNIAINSAFGNSSTDLTLIAGGNISGSAKITADTLDLVAGGSVYGLTSSDALSTTVSYLSASVGTGLNISNSSALVLNGISSTTGDISIYSGGNLTVASGYAVKALGGDISLSNANSKIIYIGTASTDSGSEMLYADGSVTITSGTGTLNIYGDITANGNNLDSGENAISISGGNYQYIYGSTITANSGDIYLQTAWKTYYGQTEGMTLSAEKGSVTIHNASESTNSSYVFQILNNSVISAGTDVNITSVARQIAIVSATISADNDIDIITNVDGTGSYSTSSEGTANISITEGSITAGGDVNIIANSVEDTTNTVSLGSATIEAGYESDDSATVTLSGSTITGTNASITADNLVATSTTGAINIANANVDNALLTSTSGNITFTNTGNLSVAASTSGTVDITVNGIADNTETAETDEYEAGNLNIVAGSSIVDDSTVSGITATSSTVTLDVAGDITSSLDTAVTASTLDMTAGGSIGSSTQALNTSVSNLKATSTIGNIDLSDTLGALNLYDISAEAGYINIDAYGSITLASGYTVEALGDISFEVTSGLTTAIDITGKITTTGDIVLWTTTKSSATASNNYPDIKINSGAELSAENITLYVNLSGAVVNVVSGSTLEATDTIYIVSRGATTIAGKLIADTLVAYQVHSNRSLTVSNAYVNNAIIYNTGTSTTQAHSTSFTNYGDVNLSLYTGTAANGVSVTVKEDSSVDGDTGSLTIVSATNAFADNDLILATDTTNISATGITTKGGSLTVIADGGITVNAAITSTINTSTSTFLGNISLTSLDGDITLNAGVTSTYGTNNTYYVGNISLDSADDIILNAGITSNVATTDAYVGNITLEATGDIVSYDSSSISTGGALILTAGGSVGVTTNSATITLNATQDDDDEDKYAGDVSITSTNTTSDTTLSLNTVTGTEDATSGISTSGTVALSTTTADIISSDVTASDDSVELIVTGSIEAGTLVVSTTTGDITLTTGINVDNAVLTSTSGDIALSSVSSSATEEGAGSTLNVAASTSGDITITNTGNINVTSITYGAVAGNGEDPDADDYVAAVEGTTVSGISGDEVSLAALDTYLSSNAETTAGSITGDGTITASTSVTLNAYNDIGSSTSYINTDTGSLTIGADTDNAYIENSGNVSVATSGTLSSLYLVVNESGEETGDLTSSGTLSASEISLSANDINVSVDTTSLKALDISTSGGLVDVDGDSISLYFTSDYELTGSVGDITFVFENTAGGIVIGDTVLDSDIVNKTSSIRLIANGDITGTGTITTNTLTLIATGSIYGSVNENYEISALNTKVSSLDATAGADQSPYLRSIDTKEIHIANEGDLTLTGASATNAISITATTESGETTADLTISGEVASTSGSVELVTDGSIIQGTDDAVVSGSSLSLTADNIGSSDDDYSTGAGENLAVNTTDLTVNLTGTDYETDGAYVSNESTSNAISTLSISSAGGTVSVAQATDEGTSTTTLSTTDGENYTLASDTELTELDFTSSVENSSLTTDIENATSLDIESTGSVILKTQSNFIETSVTGSDVTISLSEDVSLTGDYTIKATEGDITFTTSEKTITINASSDNVTLTLNAEGDIVLGNISSSGDYTSTLSLIAGGSVSQLSGTTITADALSLDITGGVYGTRTESNGSYTYSGNLSTAVSSISGEADVEINISNSTALAVGNLESDGDIEVKTNAVGATLVVGGAVSSTSGSVTIATEGAYDKTAGSSAITINGSVSAESQDADITLSVSGSGTGITVNGTLTANDTVTINASGVISASGAISATNLSASTSGASKALSVTNASVGNATLYSNGGAITFTNTGTGDVNLAAYTTGNVTATVSNGNLTIVDYNSTGTGITGAVVKLTATTGSITSALTTTAVDASTSLTLDADTTIGTGTADLYIDTPSLIITDATDVYIENSGNLSLNISGTSGDISVAATEDDDNSEAGDITLAAALTATGKEVTLNADGSIIGGSYLITATTLDLSAGGSVYGTSADSALSTKITNLSANVSGSIYLSNSAELYVLSTASVEAGGDIYLDSGTNTMYVYGEVSTTGGDITVTANRFQVGGTTYAYAGNASLSATELVDGTKGNISITTSYWINAYGKISAANTLSLTSGTSIATNKATRITAETLVASAGSYIALAFDGSNEYEVSETAITYSIDVDKALLTAGTSYITLTNTGDLNVAASASANVTIDTAGSLTISEFYYTTTTGEWADTSSVDTTTVSGISGATVELTATTGSITSALTTTAVDASTSLTLDAGSTIGSSLADLKIDTPILTITGATDAYIENSGNLSLTAASGAVSGLLDVEAKAVEAVADTDPDDDIDDSVTAEDGSITIVTGVSAETLKLTAAKDITGSGTIEATSDSTDTTLSLIATGSITATGKITATVASLTAGTTIGSSTESRLSLDVDNLTITSGTDVYIANEGDLTLAVTNAISSLNLLTSDEGDITIATAGVNVGTGTATLNAAGDILSEDSSATLTAGTANLTAGGSIGEATTVDESTTYTALNTEVSTLSVTAGADSDDIVYVSNTGALSLSGSAGGLVAVKNTLAINIAANTSLTSTYGDINLSSGLNAAGYAITVYGELSAKDTISLIGTGTTGNSRINIYSTATVSADTLVIHANGAINDGSGVSTANITVNNALLSSDLGYTVEFANSGDLTLAISDSNKLIIDVVSDGTSGNLTVGSLSYTDVFGKTVSADGITIGGAMSGSVDSTITVADDITFNKALTTGVKGYTGTLTLDAGGDISGAGTITLTNLNLEADGSIYGENDTVALNTVVSTLTASAGTGINVKNTVNLTLNDIKSTSGDITIDNTGTLGVASEKTVSTAGNIDIESTGNMTNSGTIKSTGGDIDLESTGGTFTNTATPTGVDTTDYIKDYSIATRSTYYTGGEIIADGSISIITAGKAMTMSVGTYIYASGNNLDTAEDAIYIDAGSTLTWNNNSYVYAGMGDIYIYSAFNLKFTDTTGSTVYANNGSISLDAPNYIINLGTNTYYASNNIDMTVLGLGSNGYIALAGATITAGNTLTMDAYSYIDSTNDTGSISAKTIIANAGTKIELYDVSATTAILSSEGTGAISLENISTDSLSVAATTGGTVEVTTAGSLTIIEGTGQESILYDDEDKTIVSSGFGTYYDIVDRTVTGVSGTTVTLTADGSISSDLATAVDASTSLTLKAGSTIGTGTADLKIDTPILTITGATDAYIENSGNLSLTASGVTGLLDVEAKAVVAVDDSDPDDEIDDSVAAEDGNITIATGVSAGTLKLTAAKDITATGTITATSSEATDTTLSLIATGSISGAGKITATVATLQVAGDIGSTGTALNTEIDNLTLSTATTSDVYISNTGDLVIDKAINTDVISLAATGTITSALTTAITANDLTLSATDTIGSSETSRLSVDVDNLTITSGTDVYITNAGDLNLTVTSITSSLNLATSGAGNITIAATGVNVTGTAALNAAGDILSEDSTATLTAGTADLTAGGSISGSTTNDYISDALSTIVSNLSASAGGSLAISNNLALTIASGTSISAVGDVYLYNTNKAILNEGLIESKTGSVSITTTGTYGGSDATESTGSISAYKTITLSAKSWYIGDNAKIYAKGETLSEGENAISVIGTSTSRVYATNSTTAASFLADNGNIYLQGGYSYEFAEGTSITATVGDVSLVHDTTLAAGSGGSLTFSGIIVNASGNITISSDALTNSKEISIGASGELNAGGTIYLISDNNKVISTGTISAENLVVSAAGAISITGTTTVETATLTSTSSGNIKIENTGSLSLAASAANGEVEATVNAVEAVEESGSVEGGDYVAAVEADAGNLTITEYVYYTENGTLVDTTDGDYEYNSATMTQVSGVSGTTVTLTADGSITSELTTAVDATTLTLDAGADIASVSQSLNTDVANLAITSAVNAYVSNTGDLSIAAAGVSVDSLTLITSGALTQSGDLEVEGLASITATASEGEGYSDITLTNTGNSFGSIDLRGNAVSLTEAGDTVIAGINADSLILVSTGEISQTGDLLVSNLASFSATNGTTLTALYDESTLSNSFGSLALSGGAANVVENDAETVLAGVNVSSLEVTSSGDITQSDTITVTGETNLTAEGNSIELENTANDFQGAVSATADSAILVDANDLELGEITANTLSAQSEEGSVTQSSTGFIKAKNITINAGNNVVLDGATIEASESLNVTAGSSATFNNDINIEGSFEVTAQKVTVQNVYTTGSQSYNVASQNPNEEGNDLNNPIEIQGTELVSTEGDIKLGSALDEVPTVATIVATGDSLTISANNVEMGQNQNLLSTGSVSIVASETATLSDIRTPESLSVNAGEITLLLRDKMTYTDLESGEILSDEGLTFIAKDIDFGDAVVSTSAPAEGEYSDLVYFYTQAGEFSENIDEFYLLVDDSISLETFVGESGLLENAVVAVGYSIQNLATELGDTTTHNIPTVSTATAPDSVVSSDNNISGLDSYTEANTSEIGQDKTAEALDSVIEGLDSSKAESVQSAYDAAFTTTVDGETTSTIPAIEASVAESYASYTDELGASAEAAPEATSTEPTEATEASPEATSDSAEALEATETPSEATEATEPTEATSTASSAEVPSAEVATSSMEGFKEYLLANATEHSETISALKSMAKLFAEISESGMSEEEAEAAKAKIASTLKIEGLSTENIVELVNAFMN